MCVLLKFIAPVVFLGQFDPATFSGTMGHPIALSSSMNKHTPMHVHTHAYLQSHRCVDLISSQLLIYLYRATHTQMHKCTHTSKHWELYCVGPPQHKLHICKHCTFHSFDTLSPIWQQNNNKQTKPNKFRASLAHFTALGAKTHSTIACHSCK